MKSFLFLIAIIILIGGTYSIGFYNGNNNANKKVDIAISGGKEFMKIYPPDGSSQKKKTDSGSELTDEEKVIIQKVKSGEMSMDEVPEDLRNKIRTGFVSENKPSNFCQEIKFIESGDEKINMEEVNLNDSSEKEYSSSRSDEGVECVQQ